MLVGCGAKMTIYIQQHIGIIPFCVVGSGNILYCYGVTTAADTQLKSHKSWLPNIGKFNGIIVGTMADKQKQ